MTHLDLNPQPSGYFHGYNESVDASVANSFAAAAFRFGHTLLPVSPVIACARPHTHTTSSLA